MAIKFNNDKVLFTKLIGGYKHVSFGCPQICSQCTGSTYPPLAPIATISGIKNYTCNLCEQLVGGFNGTFVMGYPYFHNVSCNWMYDYGATVTGNNCSPYSSALSSYLQLVIYSDGPTLHIMTYQSNSMWASYLCTFKKAMTYPYSCQDIGGTYDLIWTSTPCECRFVNATASVAV